jgi:hypothetical protein
MFGIFQPPLFHIKKRIPQHAFGDLTTVETFGQKRLEDLPEMHRQYAFAFIVSVWACNSAMAGKFQLAHKDYLFIQRSGMNAVGWLKKPIADRAGAIVDELKASGLIPG